MHNTITAFWIRKSHKWLALITGLQLLIWLGSGAYMVLMDIEFIRGKTLTNAPTSKPLQANMYRYSFNDLLKDYPDATEINLYTLGGNAVYSARMAGKLQRLDATTGHLLPILSEQQAIEIASQLYRGDTKVNNTVLYQQHPPREISARFLPVWAVEFASPMTPTLYISAVTGQLVSTRHNYWRAFDFLWMLHIMDYEEREDVNNNLLGLVSSLSLLTAMFGIALTYISFRRHLDKQDD
ncbi:peptidase [Shewanella sp. A25]|nr:peptidase [Shewanella shenzhenensis]